MAIRGIPGSAKVLELTLEVRLRGPPLLCSGVVVFSLLQPLSNWLMELEVVEGMAVGIRAVASSAELELILGASL